jgi:phenylalanyl-tRNA synthetase beta chain
MFEMERTLTADDLVICDAEGPVGLGGVMGAANSEVQATTKRVLFECAYFDPRGVRRSARRHGLHTEASHRFERGVDPGDVADVLTHAASLATALAGGAAVPGAIHAMGKKAERRRVTLRSQRIDQILGVAVPWDEAVGILSRLGCTLHASGKGSAELDVPTHRPDITREIDLIEEVARVRGMDSIPAVLPAIRPTRDEGARESLLRRARAAAVGIGLYEAITYSFVRPSTLDALGAEPASVILQNPLGEHQSVMRTSLLPGLIDAIAHARRHGERDVRLFTVGPTFTASKTAGALPEERLFFAAVLAGDRPAYLTKPTPVDVWDAKGIAEAMAHALVSLPAEARAFAKDARPKRLHPRGAAVIDVRGTPVGTLGLLHPDVADALGLEGTGDLVLVEIDLQALEAFARGAKVDFKALPRFPASVRDLAVVVSDAVHAGDVLAAVKRAAGELAEEVSLFDRYAGGQIPVDHANLAFRVVYRRPDRTLTDAEVDAQHAKVVAEVEGKFGATLRA